WSRRCRRSLARSGSWKASSGSSKPRVKGGREAPPPGTSVDGDHRRNRELRVRERLRDPRRQQRVRPSLPAEGLFRAGVAQPHEGIEERGSAGEEPGRRSPSPSRVGEAGQVSLRQRIREALRQRIRVSLRQLIRIALGEGIQARLDEWRSTGRVGETVYRQADLVQGVDALVDAVVQDLQLADVHLGCLHVWHLLGRGPNSKTTVPKLGAETARNKSENRGFGVTK